MDTSLEDYFGNLDVEKDVQVYTMFVIIVLGRDKRYRMNSCACVDFEGDHDFWQIRVQIILIDLPSKIKHYYDGVTTYL